MHPYFDFGVLADADLIFLDIECVGVQEDVMKALEAGLEQVEIVREGDICDLAETERGVLDVDVVLWGAGLADKRLSETLDVFDVY